MMDPGNHALVWMRPEWLLGLLPWLVGLLVWSLGKARRASAWDKAVDPALRAYVIEDDGGERVTETRSAAGGVRSATTGWFQRQRASAWLLFLGWFLALLVLAGPVWEQQEIPVLQGQQAQVILFDLSQSMLVDDVSPDRMTRARFKLQDLLRQAAGLQVALVGFTVRPYVISPLTEDTQTILAFVPSLAPEIMPVQGSNVALAIDRGVQLLQQAGNVRGQLILITDTDYSPAAEAAARRARLAGHRVSVLGVGTAEGSPLRGADGRFLKDANGGIVLPRVDLDSLEPIARAGGGVVVRLSPDSSDLQALTRVQEQLSITEVGSEDAPLEVFWVEYGPWFLILLLALSLLLFRRGVFA